MGQAGKGGGARYETVELIVSPAKFDGEVLALDIAAGDGDSGPPDTPRSPWQNPYIERLIGALWRDCFWDHVLILAERHLRRMLTLYSRTHLGLSKDAPRRRAVQRSGTIVTTQVLSGLHHRYVRI